MRTHRIALSFALFNILVLFSRTANGFLGPFLAKRIETRLRMGGGSGLESDFRIVLLAASIAVLTGIVLIPTGQRLFARAIAYYQDNRSTGRLLMRCASPAGLRVVRESVAVPGKETLHTLAGNRGVGWSVLLSNMVAQALLTVGVLASLYAGFLAPEFRVTASQLSAVVNGFATILLFALIDPQLSVMTDDVVDGKVSEAQFRRTIGWISLSRLAGTLLAQLLFLPAAAAIAMIAVYV